MAIFSQNPFMCTDPFRKMQIWIFFFNRCFYSLKRLFFHNFTKRIFQIHFLQKKKDGKISIFDKNHGLTPLEKCKFCGFLKSMSLQSKKFSFSLSNFTKKFFLHPFCIKTNHAKISIFYKNHGLTPLEKCKFGGSFKSFSFQSFNNHFFTLSILHKNKEWKNLNF